MSIHEAYDLFAQGLENYTSDIPEKISTVDRINWWCRHKLKVRNTRPQRRILKAFSEGVEGIGPKKLAVKSAVGIGKTLTCAEIVHAFLHEVCNDRGIVISTAPTGRQVKELLWKEIKRLHINNNLSGQCFQVPRIEVIKNDLYAFGFSTDKPVNFQGFHEPNVLVIADEANGIQNEQLWESLEGCIVSDNCFLVEISNPVECFGHFYNACTNPDEGFRVITVSAFEHPNIRSGKELIAGATTRQYVEDCIRKYGRNSSWVKSRIFGEFPETSSDTLFHPSTISACINRHRHPEKYPSVDPSFSVVSIDPARYGSDDTAVVMGSPWRVEKLELWQNLSTVEIANKILKHPEFSKARMIVCSSLGIGAGVVDILRSHKKNVHDFKESAGSEYFDDLGENPYLNLRAEAYFRLNEQIDEWSLPDHNYWTRELCSIGYEYTPSGLIKVESKRDIKKRLGKSPDLADALTQLNWVLLNYWGDGKDIDMSYMTDKTSIVTHSGVF